MTPTQLKNRCVAIWYNYHFAWLQFTSILETLSQRDELEHLIRWAQRKRISGVREHYQWLLADVERRLLVKAVHNPRLTNLAEWTYCIQGMLCPAPSFYPKGAAAKYRLRNRSLI